VVKFSNFLALSHKLGDFFSGHLTRNVIYLIYLLSGRPLFRLLPFTVAGRGELPFRSFILLRREFAFIHSHNISYPHQSTYCQSGYCACPIHGNDQWSIRLRKREDEHVVEPKNRQMQPSCQFKCIRGCQFQYTPRKPLHFGVQTDKG